MSYKSEAGLKLEICERNLFQILTKEENLTIYCPGISSAAFTYFGYTADFVSEDGNIKYHTLLHMVIALVMEVPTSHQGT